MARARERARPAEFPGREGASRAVHQIADEHRAACNDDAYPRDRAREHQLDMLPSAARRLVLHAALAAIPVRVHDMAVALPPPTGSVVLLLPLVQQRLLLAECSAAIAEPATVSWSALRSVFTGPPFTPPEGDP